MSKNSARLPAFASVVHCFDNSLNTPIVRANGKETKASTSSEQNYDAELDRFQKMQKESIASFAALFPTGAVLSEAVFLE